MDQAKLSAARDAFLDDGVVSDGVRDETVRAWRRSRAAGARHDCIPKVVLTDVDLDSALRQAAEPVVASLMQTLGSAEYAMMITDRDARIVGRWTSGSTMCTLLDKMGVLMGALFEEASVGSTGLGTVLEDRTVAVVDGAEHYNRRFDPVIAVGAPIVHPGTGCVEGVLDLVCPTGAPAEIMVALTERAAKDTGERLLSGYAAEDHALLDAFLRVDRRGPKRPVMAMNGRLVMANQHAEALLGFGSHGALWQQVTETLVGGQTSMRITAPSGIEFDVSVRQVESFGTKAGALLQLGSGRGRRGRTERQPPDAAADIVVQVVKRAPGHTVTWRAALGAAARALVNEEHVLLHGSVGVGKTTLAQALVEAVSRGRSHAPAKTVTLVDDLQTYSRADLARLRRQLRDPDPDCGLIVATATSPVCEEIRAMFTHLVEVPELSRRRDDIGVIVSEILARRCPDYTLSGDALRELTNRTWNGNIDELERVVMAAVDRAPGSQVGVSHILFDSNLKGPRRRLTYLESVEREAIAQVLRSVNGSKTRTAEMLGVSRATLYRKLAAFALD